MHKEQNSLHYVLMNQMKKRLAARLEESEIPDVFEVSNKTSAIKYITPEGRVRLDIDFDEFKKIFYQALWNSYIQEITIQGAPDIENKIPSRLKMALDLYNIDRETADKAEAIRLVRPMFDYREKRKQ